MSRLPDFDVLWDYDDPAATEAKFRALLPEFEASGDSGRYAELVTQIARTYSLRSEFAASHAMLDSVDPLLGACGARANIRYLLERGRTLNSAGDPAAARPLFEQAWDTARDAREDLLAIDAAHMVVLVAQTADALIWTEKALDLAERSMDPSARDWKGSLYNNIGWTYLDADRNEEALDAFQKGLDFRLEKGAIKPIRIARYAVGRALRSLGRVGEALEIQKAVHAEWEADGQKSPYADEEIGECLLLLGRPAQETALYFASAYAELSRDTWFSEHEAVRLERLRKLSLTPN